MISAPKLVGMTGIGGDEGRFNPHFDVTVGQYFGSLAEKRKYLGSKDMEDHGSASPRRSNKTRIICSRQQANKFKDLRKAAPLVKGL